MTDTSSNQEIQGLISILEGGLKERRRHWYTLGIKISHYYDLDEQLDAIRQLSLSGSNLSLDYLKKIAEKKEWYTAKSSLGHVSHSCHPYAKGVLGAVLHSSQEYFDGYGNPSDKDPRRGTVLIVLSEAISRLESSLNSKN